MLEFDEGKKIDIDSYLEIMGYDIPTRLKNILKEETFYSEKQLYQRLEEIVLEHTSYYLFPGDQCSFYPKFVESKATKNFTCYLSGAPIVPGESYYTYRPLIKNLNTHKSYTISSSIIASAGYIDLFPTTLLDFEEWCRKLEQAEYSNDDEIDFYGFSCIAGSNCLYPKELHDDKETRKRRRNINKIKNLEKTEKEILETIDFSINPEETEKRLQKIKIKIKQLQDNF